jgi:hypothetical protein
MTAKELRLVATGKGVSDDAIEIARDAHDPRAELIALIQAHENTPDPAPIDYGSMTVGELREMASKAGIAHEAIEDARDGDDPRAELIALITTTQSEQGLGPWVVAKERRKRRRWLALDCGLWKYKLHLLLLLNYF